ncbi:division/cell wall cluster transcriptional repressor MraZ [Pseudoclavibacter soli]|uniref:division/cell wall cluster transcriptional repressor MraZ n=1 Tax=Pseudoclavibacter soli TaxID=452623 RepID=UPI000481326A|nr:division/cell wall cluster transcriptional repressor MraZ [Pseudoclavibacter soli]
MFLGTHSPRLDEKGRLFLPAKFREELAQGVVLTRGQEHCVYVFSAREFERIHETIRQAPMTSKQARDFLRLFLSGASDQVPDRQGRITVPADLRRYAGLERDLAVIGTGNRAEIWSATAWDDYLQAQEDPFAETAEEVIPGVF